ncbi:MAG: hypothetical protein V4463_01300 [Pseudomonadota bacterium]
MMRASIVAGLCSLALGPAHADGMSDLKAALARLKGQASLHAVLDTRTTRRLGDGPEDQGQASVILDDGSHGLQVTYPRETAARMAREVAARGRDPNAKAPTAAALREVDAIDLLQLASAVGAIERALAGAVFKGERPDNRGGKAVRLLSFAMPIETLSERDRKYAKSLDASYDIWIDSDGTPLASRLHQVIGGRAFIVVGFDTRYDELCTYQQSGDRLLVLRKESSSSASGAGERDERKTITTLRPEA